MQSSHTRRIRRVSAVTVVALVGGFAAVAPSSQAAPDTAEHGYVVTLKSDTRAASAEGRDIADEYGVKISRTYRSALNGFAVKASAAEAQRLAADPSVSAVSPDVTLHTDARQVNPPSWGEDRIDQAKLPLDRTFRYPNSAGAGVTVYVIDTGVRTTHSEFGGRARSGFDFVDNDPIAEDGNGHGTHVAGTIAGTKYGVAKKAKVVGVRVLNNQGSGTLSGVIAGIDFVTRNARKPAVANMSLGGSTNAQLDQAVRNSIRSGVTYSVAAGNSGQPASGTSPARVAEALTIGATDRGDTRPAFSNYGLSVDMFAPGVAIKSAGIANDNATATLSGTSMAAPHVAGAAALYLADRRSAPPSEVMRMLVNRTAKNRLINVGPGSPNRLLQVKS
ncbi:S8 family peptidase [Streptomyces sp. AN091965]|uniref:S8 family peptidase n=1 Tax=Streptomyces sp. AN091965 TaxID=2927803 RepID=UPI001F609490|nr:S8 family peptidase [Streptomyces sp. AN091965]MCI3933174.1 S8 family peptidase [Streptomyces sp. AN091965]